MIYEKLTTPVATQPGDIIHFDCNITAPCAATYDRFILLADSDNLPPAATTEIEVDILSKLVAQLGEKNRELQAQVEQHTDLAHIVIAQAEKIRDLEARPASPGTREPSPRRRRRR